MNFFGEHECKVDTKGRIMFPASYRKKIEVSKTETLIISKGLDRNLNLFTAAGWEKQKEKFKTLNQFNPKERELYRFLNVAEEVSLDTIGRILIKDLMVKYAEIELGNSCVLCGFSEYVEIWSLKNYEERLLKKQDPEYYSNLAELFQNKFNVLS